MEMPFSMFKIYDGRTNFWQWDTKQKLVVLDDSVTEVHFSNRDMNHSIKRFVYELDGKRVCNVPDIILQLPRNLVAYAYANGSTIKSVKFAVIKRPIPNDYVMDQNEQVEDIENRLLILESVLKDISQNGSTSSINKFDSIKEAETWASDKKTAGDIIAIRINGKWIAHIVEDDFTITPICDCDGKMVEIEIFDGGDADGHEVTDIVQVWDGGGAAGF